ncbi:GNAT family N-acetyltransferase [Pseudalkalibacillus sp. SCS-8]|uniref:GNAT family N-acetyltransferase n=1 Tax=Pseudalkalibacillus nanhaiensis TaxID=3115291 RepID=UPI0032D9C791
MIEIRNMREEDKDFILDLSSRLSDIEYMSWRDRQQMQMKQREIVKEAIDSNTSTEEIFVAVDIHGTQMGFIHLTESRDYFTNEKQAYISLLAVSKEGEGKGIAKRLMAQAEDWAKNKGYKQLTLNVFSSNERAVGFYENLSFHNEVQKMVKEL